MTAIRPLPRKASLVLSVAKLLALGLVLAVLVSSGATQAPTRGGPDAAALRFGQGFGERLDQRLIHQGAKELRTAMTAHECTATGFGDRAAPRSALVRHHGRLQHVSFDRAWSVFTGEVPGVLVAVCLDEPLVAEDAVASRT